MSDKNEIFREVDEVLRRHKVLASMLVIVTSDGQGDIEVAGKGASTLSETDETTANVYLSMESVTRRTLAQLALTKKNQYLN